jgi:D-alanyl-lipoteichoic acid acyltransferase DltB (MBOAT superfamily)
MTLSRFLRDYLYFPLGGNRKGDARRYANLMITMLLGGLWRGASWNFVAWGGIHSVALSVNHLWHDKISGGRRLPSGLSRVLTLAIVLWAWVPFRAKTFDHSLTIWRSMIGLGNIDSFRLTSAASPHAMTGWRETSSPQSASSLLSCGGFYESQP